MVPRRYRYRRFTETDRDEIWRLVAAGMPYADVAAALDTTREGVRALLRHSGGVRPRPAIAPRATCRRSSARRSAARC
ncbi:MAG: hypothetical protein M3406_03305 [Chloroflexota bacterium]|nr:hypothetical protein [Chloroflexota bacterium]